LKESAASRHYNALVFLSALSDYPDQVFNYEKRESEIKKVIKEAYKNVALRQAFKPFYMI